MLSRSRHNGQSEGWNKLLGGPEGCSICALRRGGHRPRRSVESTYLQLSFGTMAVQDQGRRSAIGQLLFDSRYSRSDRLHEVIQVHPKSSLMGSVDDFADRAWLAGRLGQHEGGEGQCQLVFPADFLGGD